jgi:hypothetical protein
MVDQQPLLSYEPERAAFLAYERAILMLASHTDQLIGDQFEELVHQNVKS